MRPKLKIGIVGCGTIGSFIARSAQNNLKDKVDLVGVCDNIRSKAESLAKSLKRKVSVLQIDKLIDKVDFVVEAASKDAVGPIARKVLSKGKSIMVMSVGGLLGSKDLFRLAEEKNAEILLPSGALCGLDGLKSAAIEGIKSVVLTTKKSKQALEGAPYILKNKINLAKIDKETIIFEGNAKQAVMGFPQNVNVAALLSLAGIGPKRTRVKIIVSPSEAKNVHEIRVNGKFGMFCVVTENVPFPENPKTSFLAALSAVATLKNVVSNIKIGT